MEGDGLVIWGFRSLEDASSPLALLHQLAWGRSRLRRARVHLVEPPMGSTV